MGELPLSTQVRLLRVLQTGEFIRVGSAKVQKTNVRVVAATNNNLMQAIAEGRFREDLYYRLNTVPIQVPSLRERPEDIHMLFRRFASDVAVRYRMPAITLDDAARKMLEEYYWRGNIRQLKNVAEQISAIEQTREITPEVLSRYLNEMPSSSPSVAGAMRVEDMNSERELLYKILFDMRNDINDLKRMLVEMRGGYGVSSHVPTPHRNDIAGLLPSSPAVVDEYAESEVVVDDVARPMSKNDVLRDQIVKALRRNGGSRRAAAAELFMSERTLYRKIKDLGIEE